ncbi:histidinol-phosphate transaminase [Fictibacillus barbaricus]|uniref:Histidinol-phosphate aminotransferase n=1 Tax=Fictibacillus barbaricus TaxID=182136 RepID=A0ABU1TZ91_9BACL|nr:histidinol-phosphate transaminase [Fictibacillus barbaricus]MDR7072534.1 histidinol-phosphate aminotransferase [Fictibacillus barbaricus]
MQPKKQLLSLTPYKPGKPVEEVKRELGLEKIVKLASNENPYGCSQLAKDKIVEELSNLNVYPDGYSAEIREKLSRFLGVSNDQLIFGNGSDEVVQILCRAYLSPETNTVMAAPTFPQYRHNAVIEGAEVREIQLVNGHHDLDAMVEAIDKQTRIVWLCNPNNPTGNYIPEGEFVAFMKKVPRDVLVVSDEAYFEYVAASDYPNTISYLNDYPNLVILRTFSKAHGLAALRIGYGIGSSSIIQSIEPAREPFNTSRIAQAAAIGALDDHSFIEECKQKNREGLELFYEFCDKKGLLYYPSEANFILLDVQSDADSAFNYLLKKGYIVRSGNALGFPTMIRVTIGEEEQNKEIIAHLDSYLATLVQKVNE